MRRNEKRKGIWIPNEMMKNKELDWINKILLAEIHSLSELKSGCIASNAYFGDLLGITPGAVSKRITRLTQLGYINAHTEYENHWCMGRSINPTNKKWKPTSINDPVEVVPETPEGTSSTDMGISFGNGGSSQTTSEGILERPGGSSHGNTTNTITNTITNTEINTFTNTATNTEGLVQNFQEELPDDVTLADCNIMQIENSNENSGSGPEQNIAQPESEIPPDSYDSNGITRTGMQYIFHDYPDWERHLSIYGMDWFIKKTAKYHDYVPHIVRMIESYVKY